MKLKYLFAPVLMAAFCAPVMAADCSVDIDANDAMKFDKSEIVVDKSCKEFTINVHHSGKLARNVMGHNVVITKTDDSAAVARDGVAAGLDNQYLKPNDDRVIASTNIIGGGEKTSTTFSVEKLAADQSYTFFCSFPGHVALMKGTVSVK